MQMISVSLVKLLGVLFCLFHIIRTKGKFFTVREVLLAVGWYFFQGAVFFLCSELFPHQQWEFDPAVINHSISSIMIYLDKAHGDFGALWALLWKNYGVVTFLNFPNFYFILILLSRDKKIRFKGACLYIAWCLLIGYAQTQLLAREVRHEKVRQQVVQKKIQEKLYSNRADE